MVYTKTQWHGNVHCWLLSALSVQCIWLNAHAHKCTWRTHTHKHTQSYFSVVYQIWAYSCLVLSIYSRVHLGEPKLIEAHHNGLFISYWADRPTPSLSLSPLLPLSLSAPDMKGEVESGWCRTACAWLLGPQGHLCAFKMDSESSFLSPTGWLVFLFHTYTHKLYTHRSTQALVYFQTITLALFHFNFILNFKLPFFPHFSFLIRYFQIFPLPHRTVIWSIVLPSTPSPSVSHLRLSISFIIWWEFRWILQSHNQRAINARMAKTINSNRARLLQCTGLINYRQLRLRLSMFEDNPLYRAFMKGKCSSVYSNVQKHIKWINVR